MPLGKNFYKTANFLSRIFLASGDPGHYRGPGPEASASPASFSSWMIRPCDHFVKHNVFYFVYLQ